MHSPFLPSYLRTYRRRLGFSQEHIAFLLSASSGTEISRHERFSRQPTLATAFAYEAIFQVPTSKLFAGIFAKAVAKVARNARTLLRRAETGRVSGLTNRQIDVLRSISGEVSQGPVET